MSRKSLRAVGRCIVGPPPQRGRLVRARQTAHIVAEGRDVTEVPALREVQLGAMEGLSYDDLRPEPTPEGIDVSEVRWAGGESLADVAARLRPVLEELDSCFSDYDEVLLVSHADTLRVLVALLDGRDHRGVDWDAFATWPIGAIVTRTWPRPA